MASLEPPVTGHACAAGKTTPKVEVDELERPDSIYDDEISSYVSSVLDWEWKHGRRYHSYQAGSYSFPNDEHEQNRLAVVHRIFYRALGDRLFLAPINPDGLRILDIGTGTGDLYPSAEIVGNDLSPIQPQWLPPNVKFQVDDVEKEWVQPEPYDFIHSRYMCGAIRDWPKLVRQCYQNLKPGGWVEFVETNEMPYSEDNSESADNHVIQMLKLLAQACNKIERPLGPGPSLRGWVEDAGFTNISEEVFKMPIGTWPKDRRLKEIGALMTLDIAEGVEGFTLVPFIEVLGWCKEDLARLNEKVRKDLRRRDQHILYDV
ncbi:hypothetical protein VTN02DRAFT_306 [Thermoascus thermophilus]